MGKSIVDVAVLTYKPDEKFIKLMDSLRLQDVKPGRIIIVNTEEKYLERLIFGTDFIKKNPSAEIHNISRKEFDHAGTRNKAARYSDAEFLIFMTQDAVPADTHLISNLLKPMEDVSVAVSYGRQLPGKDAGIIERYNRDFNYPDKDRLKTASDIPELGIKTIFCSDVCACYRRSFFDERGGFSEPAIFNEDMVFAYGAIKAGMGIYYSSGAKVVHSHEYTVKQQFKRNFDLGVSQAVHSEVFGNMKSEGEGKKLVKGCIKKLLSDHSAHLIPGFIVHCAARFLGYKLGRNYEHLSRRMIMMCTNNVGYWKD
ncbi:MAG: glycosyltransferase [Lachnospiraceae bacterium]|nr:glycosyltransferase [Lachnospiraceae bacterium]